MATSKQAGRAGQAVRAEAQRIARDLAYIKQPLMWVTMLCPLVREVEQLRGRLPAVAYRQTAYLTGAKPIVRFGNIHNPMAADAVKEYASHEALLADGWRVD